MKGWALERLGDICEVNIGRTPARDRPEYWGSGHPWLSIADMNQGREIFATKEAITNAAIKDCNCRQVAPGTILLSFKLSIGKVSVARIPIFTNEAIAALPIRDKSRVLPDYLYWVLKSIDLTVGLDRAAKGLTLNKAKLLEIGIPLPALPDQLRIAAILDKADEVRTKRRAADEQLNRLTDALFSEMFGDPVTNPRKWPVVSLESVSSQITDGEHITPKRSAEGIKLLSARNVRDGSLDFGDVDYIGAEEFARISRRCKPERGDVLISCSGTVGRAATVEVDEPLALVRSVAMVKVNRGLAEPKYLEHYLRTPYMRFRMLSRANASSQANLFLGQIRELPVMLPDRAVQEDFCQRLKRIATIERTQQESSSLIETLFSSLKQQAFSGAL